MKTLNFSNIIRLIFKEDSAMFYTDILTPGYSSNGQDFTYNYMHLINEIYIDNQLVVFDNMMLSPDKSRLDGIGYMENYTHLGSAYFYSSRCKPKFHRRYLHGGC